MIPISKPIIGENEMRAVQNVLESGMLAQGARVADFECAFAEYTNVKHAIATSNGTTALHIALLANGIGAGDQVITTPFTFIASVNSILYTGALPSLIDIAPGFNLDIDKIEAAINSQTRAIMPVHLFGQPCDMRAIMDIAARHNLSVIEDACQAHGARFEDKLVGSFGTGCFSFYATKNMTTGEGGMITTNDDGIAHRARLLVNHGMQVRYRHEVRGYNFRLTEVAAAIGYEQLRQLDSFNARRADNARYYDERLENVRGLELPGRLPGRSHVFHQYTIRVLPSFPLGRDEFARELNARGIGTGIYYPIPVHRQQAMGGETWAQGSFPRTEEYATQVLSLPVHPLVSAENREFIEQTIRQLAV